MVASTSRQASRGAVAPTKPERTIGAAGLALVLFALLLVLGGFCGWVFTQRMSRLYRDHIYPNVYALGVDLGGMSVDEAAAALEGVADQVDTGLLVLTDGERRWSYPWSMGGLRVDVQGTAEAAYNVGRNGNWQEQAEVWLTYRDVAPRFLFDTTAARTLLAEVDKEASQPVVDPSLKLENGEIVIVRGEAGREMDIPTTLARLREVSGTPYRIEVPLAFQTIPAAELDAGDIKSEAEALVSRQITVMSYDVLTDESFSWTLGRDDVATWLYLVPGEGGKPSVDINQYAVRDTLMGLAAGLGDGRGFRYDDAAQKVFEAFDAGEASIWLYLTHPERTYIVESGDTLTSLSKKFGMPPGLVAEANTDIDINKLFVGQEIRIPSQDILTPNMPVIGKKVVVSIAEQHTWVYENGALLWDWPVSTGIEDSPTDAGTFQILGKYENAYASQWDLWMPYFLAVYSAGGGVENGFHELPILANGNRLWAGSLGHPASFGCIILGIPAAETLYNWAEVGVTVVIQP